MKTCTARTEDSPEYLARKKLVANEHDGIIAQALEILSNRLREPGTFFGAPSTVRDFCTLHYAQFEREVFGCLYLDAQHRLIEHVQLFYGTLTQTSVYPREVVKQALALNAGAVVFVHNHPSGSAEPSRADEFLTATLKSALALVDVRLLDHIVVGNMSIVSFAERGLL